MSKAITCPGCSAPLPYDGTQSVVRCPYCGTSINLVEPAPAPAVPADPQLPDPSLSEVAQLFRAGKRVQATICYRELTGATLKEAQSALDIFALGGALRRPKRTNW